ncbi:MAG: hypothetical protein ACFCU4_08075 [Puniceicoccaceae bacterium]
MTSVSFSNWLEVLASAELPAKSRKSFEISINWFLSHLAKRNEPATVETARAFVEMLITERKPADWMVEQSAFAVRFEKFFEPLCEVHGAGSSSLRARGFGETWWHVAP